MCVSVGKLTECSAIYLWLHTVLCLESFPICLTQSSIRNRQATERPMFSKLMTAFLSNPSLLLKWTANDRSVSPQASMLGAPLEEGRGLYPNLQLKYKGNGNE